MSGIVTRRTVAQGVAWSLPVIALASAAPAVGASGQCSTNDLQFGINLAEDEGTSVNIHVFTGISSLVCTGGEDEVTLHLSFEITDPYTGWRAPGDLIPGRGAAPGTFVTQVYGGGNFNVSAGSYEVWFTAFKPAGSTPAPITFTLSGGGAPSQSLTAFATSGD